MGGILQIPFIGSANQTITITNTHNDGFNINGYYSTTSGSLKLCNPYYDCYSYLLFWRVDANASALEEAILSIYCIPQADNATEKYVTIYGLEDPNMSTCFNEPSGVPYTDAYVNLQVNTGWSGWKNITVTDIVRELMSLSTWRNNKNIPFVIVGASGYVNEIEIYDYSSGTGNSAILYIETYDDPSEKPYNGGWDHGVWVNGTDEYDIWTVWNGSALSGWIGFNNGANDYINIYDSSLTQTALTTLGETVSFGSIAPGNPFVAYANNNNTYFISYMDLATDEIQLFQIINATYAQKIKTIIAKGSLSQLTLIYKQNDNAFWIGYSEATVHKYIVYDLDTDIVSAPVNSGFVGTYGIGMIPNYDGSKIYFAGAFYSGGNKAGWAKYTDGVGMSAITTKQTAYAYASVLAKYDSGSTTHFYWLFQDGNDDWKGYYFDSDETISGVDSLSGAVTGSNAFGAYFKDAETVEIYYGVGSTTPKKIWLKERTGGVVGALGAASEVWSGSESFWGSRLESDYEGVFYSFIGGTTTTGVNPYITAYDGSMTNQLDSDEVIDICSGFNVNTITANYTQLHYINCTWTDPYVGPYIPPPDEEPYYNPDPLSFGSWYGLIGLMGMFVSIGLFYGRAQNGDITGIAYALVVFVASFAIFYGWVISF